MLASRSPAPQNSEDKTKAVPLQKAVWMRSTLGCDKERLEEKESKTSPVGKSFLKRNTWRKHEGRNGRKETTEEGNYVSPCPSLPMCSHLFFCLFSDRQTLSSNKCLTSSNRCLTSSNKKLLETSATLVVTSALLETK